MRHLAPLLAFLLCSSAWAQAFDPLSPPNTFQHPANPYYWKNDPPRADYWQQDVHYRMDARLDEVNDLIDGSIELTYWNNSPDTLREAFFHLYTNAGRPDSYRNKLAGKHHWLYGNFEGIAVKTMAMNGKEATMEMDNTIMRVALPEPILPGTKAVFTYTFITKYGGMSRMKTYTQWGFKHFNGTQWYPRISVYDRRNGWDTQQHLGHEYYGNFGTFDVNLDMPNDMVVEATGWLQNPEEVMPPELRKKLDLKNFKDKPWNEPPSVITPYDPTVRKVWTYHAEDVHDFAFTADPTYRIGEVEWNGIKSIALACEPHASKWQNAAEYAATCLRVLSEITGPYGYPKIVVADARDGMEYPMLTLDSGTDPNYRSLLMHEVAHSWFFAMVGNNETYRAMLDEGFTQFIETLGLEMADGDTLVWERPTNKYERRWTEPMLARDRLVYNFYMHAAVRDELPPINVHSDEFARLPTGYRMVYYKTAAMLFNLQYVLGDELFSGALQHYFNQWKFKHPYIEDMRQSFIDYTKVDLNWFFDQWIDTGKRLDYAVKGVKHKGQDSGQRIRFKRVGSMQMPIDFSVTANDGKQHHFHIPNTWFVKKTDAIVLPRWIGFDQLAKEYIAEVDIPSGIADVRIDPTNRLGDANPLNNSLSLPIISTFDSHIRNFPDRSNYQAFVRPDLWYNGFDGTKVGVHLNGSFLNYKHKVHLSAWLNTGLGQHMPGNEVRTDYQPLNFNFRYENGTERLLRGSRVHVGARLLDGLERYDAGFSWDVPFTKTTLYTDMRFLIRRKARDLDYLIYPEAWNLNQLNSTWNTGMLHRYAYGKGQGSIGVEVRSAGVGAAEPFAQASATARNSTPLGKLVLHTRGYAQYGTGNTPKESQLYLAGASPEEMMDNKYVRSLGFVPFDWMGFGAGVNHFHHGGGLGLRGYAGYLAPEKTPEGAIIATYAGNTGAAINGELDLDGLVRIKPGRLSSTLGLNVYLFGDIGTMGYRTVTDQGTSEVKLATPRADAGLGAALTIKKFGPLSGLKPFTIRFDMPLFLSHLPAGESDHLAFRYVVGIGRSF